MPNRRRGGKGEGTACRSPRPRTPGLARFRAQPILRCRIPVRLRGRPPVRGRGGESLWRLPGRSMGPPRGAAIARVSCGCGRGGTGLGRRTSPHSRRSNSGAAAGGRWRRPLRVGCSGGGAASTSAGHARNVTRATNSGCSCANPSRSGGRTAKRTVPAEPCFGLRESPSPRAPGFRRSAPHPRRTRGHPRCG